MNREFLLLIVTGLFARFSLVTVQTVPCIDKSDTCATDTENLCGRFEQITYDICRKSCNACDGPVLDYTNGNPTTPLTATSTTMPTTSTPPTTMPTTSTPSTMMPTTSTPSTTMPTTSTPPPTMPTTTETTTQTTAFRTTPTLKAETTTMKTTEATTSTKTTKGIITKATTTTPYPGSVPCVDKILSCHVNAQVVCGNDDHFTYDLCRKTCKQCNGPVYTTGAPLIATTTVDSLGSDQSVIEIECFYDGRSQQYDGKTTMTSPSNHTCVNWANIASVNGYTGNQFPEGNLNHNFCRDPTNTGQPFCHTLYGTESCGIRKCSGLCEDSTTVSCALFGTAACDDKNFAHTICPVTCNKCGFGLVIQTKFRL